jgi:hypothetical protein
MLIVTEWGIIMKRGHEMVHGKSLQISSCEKKPGKRVIFSSCLIVVEIINRSSATRHSEIPPKT